jgi:hypothetical protein
VCLACVSLARVSIRPFILLVASISLANAFQSTWGRPSLFGWSLLCPLPPRHDQDRSPRGGGSGEGGQGWQGLLRGEGEGVKKRRLKDIQSSFGFQSTQPAMLQREDAWCSAERLDDPDLGLVGWGRGEKRFICFKVSAMERSMLIQE